jgi:hypothetical protein
VNTTAAAALLLALLVASAPAQPDPVRFPTFSTEALDRSRVVLPDSAKGSVTVVCLAFRRQDQSQISTWLGPVEREFGGRPGFRFYEVPMMGTSIRGAARWFINTAMAAVIPRAKRRWFAPYYGDFRPIANELGITDRTRIHLFVLDRDGFIRHRASGPATAASLAALIAATDSLAR